MFITYNIMANININHCSTIGSYFEDSLEVLILFTT